MPAREQGHDPCEALAVLAQLTIDLGDQFGAFGFLDLGLGLLDQPDDLVARRIELMQLVLLAVQHVLAGIELHVLESGFEVGHEQGIAGHSAVVAELMLEMFELQDALAGHDQNGGEQNAIAGIEAMADLQVAEARGQAAAPGRGRPFVVCSLVFRRIVKNL